MEGEEDDVEATGAEQTEASADGQEPVQDATEAATGADAAQDAEGAQEGHDAAQGGEPQPKKGDVGRALHAERERRKVAEETTRRLQERLDALSMPEPTKATKLEMGEDDILDGRQVRKLLDQQRGEIRQDVAKMVQAQVRTTELMGYIDRFEAFDGETGLGNLGREVLAARLAGLTSIATPEGLQEARAMVEAVAKEVSTHQAAGQNAAVSRGAQGARTLRPGPGAGTATHIVPARKAPESLEEASAEAHRDVFGWARKARAKLGLK